MFSRMFVLFLFVLFFLGSCLCFLPTLSLADDFESLDPTTLKWWDSIKKRGETDPSFQKLDQDLTEILTRFLEEQKGSGGSIFVAKINVEDGDPKSVKAPGYILNHGIFVTLMKKGDFANVYFVKNGCPFLTIPVHPQERVSMNLGILDIPKMPKILPEGAILTKIHGKVVGYRDKGKLEVELDFIPDPLDLESFADEIREIVPESEDKRIRYKVKEDGSFYMELERGYFKAFLIDSRTNEVIDEQLWDLSFDRLAGRFEVEITFPSDSSVLSKLE